MHSAPGPATYPAALFNLVGAMAVIDRQDHRITRYDRVFHAALLYSASIAWRTFEGERFKYSQTLLNVNTEA